MSQVKSIERDKKSIKSKYIFIFKVNYVDRLSGVYEAVQYKRTGLNQLTVLIKLLRDIKREHSEWCIIKLFCSTELIPEEVITAKRTSMLKVRQKKAGQKKWWKTRNRDIEQGNI
jgi:hypothetical protein